jgi:hypothetical protein
LSAKSEQLRWLKNKEIVSKKSRKTNEQLTTVSIDPDLKYVWIHQRKIGAHTINIRKTFLGSPHFPKNKFFLKNVYSTMSKYFQGESGFLLLAFWIMAVSCRRFRGNGNGYLKF